MGRNNKQRRAAKAKQRKANRQTHTTSGWVAAGWPHVESGIGAATVALRHLVLHRLSGGTSVDLVDVFQRHPRAYQQRAIDAELASVVEDDFAGGWTPRDLHEVSVRKLGRDAARHLLDVAAAATARHPTSRVDACWAEQLRQLGAHSPTPIDGSASLAWAVASGLEWPEASPRLIELLVLACSLPVVQEVLPAPGSVRADSASSGVDEAVLHKVRALLAKAEATEFEDEADALTAKAQHLMTEHSIHHTLASAAAPQREKPRVRRFWLDAPYVPAKSLIVGAVAGSNHCVSVLSEHWGFVTLVGHDNDLDIVELLSTSLLVQATRAMTATGAHVTRSGVSRTRSFRQSFLVAYAGRIRERLREAASDAETSADAHSGGALLPVLASRDQIVADAVAALFPETYNKDVGVSNLAGWGAGRAAADLALFDIRDALPEAKRAG